MSLIQLEPRHHKIVQEILSQYQVEAFVFGSRVKNSARTFSDLDLCLKQDYDKTTIRKLHEAFEESNLPFKVDLVLWSELSESFQRQIAQDLVKISGL
jgi:predicted nucleotidyltransferase